MNRHTMMRGWPLVLLFGAISLAACGGSNSPAPEPLQTGVLSDLPFTVIEGSVSQDADNDPVTVGSTRAVLVFDDPVSSFTTDPANFRAIVTLTMPDGGTIVIGSYGTADGLTTAYGIGATRSGSAFDYSFYYGLDETADESGAYSLNPSNPDGTLYFRAEFRADPSFALYNWTPWDAMVGACTGGLEGNAGSPPGGLGTGSRLGLVLQGVTVEDIAFALGNFNGC